LFLVLCFLYSVITCFICNCSTHCFQPLRARGDRSTDGSPDGFWGKDTHEQFAEIMLQQQTAVDIISVHTYEDDCFFIPKCRCSPLFGPARVDCDGRDALFLAATTAASAGKLLYVGEYGNVTYANATSRRYVDEVLGIQVRAQTSICGPLHCVVCYRRTQTLARPTFHARMLAHTRARTQTRLCTLLAGWL
jgi:hypothetical protein